MKIGIIGYGMVGSTLGRYLKKNNPNLEIYKYDPEKNLYDDIEKAKYVFICVPVPTKENGVQSLKILNEAINMCNHNQEIFIRSTVLPGTCDLFARRTGLKINSLPEFLTERRASYDMENLSIILGTHSLEISLVIQELFKKTPSVILPMEAELIKYTHNCFGALKVGFFNNIFEICQKFNMNYDLVKEGAIDITNFINPQHTDVPGPDGKRSFNGKCLPKDLLAFSKFAQKVIPKSEIFKAAVNDGNLYRE